MNDIILISIFFVIALIGAYCVYYLFSPVIIDNFQTPGEMSFEQASEILSDVLDKFSISDACKEQAKFCSKIVLNTCIKSVNSDECKHIINFCKNEPKSCTPTDEEMIKIISQMSEEQRAQFAQAGKIYVQGISKILEENPKAVKVIAEGTPDAVKEPGVVAKEPVDDAPKKKKKKKKKQQEEQQPQEQQQQEQQQQQPQEQM